MAILTASACHGRRPDGLKVADVHHAARTLALLGILALAGCEALVVGPAAADRNVADFEFVWNAVNEHYPYLAFKGIDWVSIHDAFLPRVEAARGDEFYAVLNDLLYQLHDGHVYYKPPGGGREIYPWVPPRRLRDQHRYNPFVVRTYFDEPLVLSPSGKLEYGILPGNLGYIFLADFHDDYLVRDFPAAMSALQGTAGLIVDIRQRVGGTPDNVAAVVSRFLTEPMPLPPAYLYGTPVDWGNVDPAGPAYTAPVIVLINGLTFSAGEFCAEMLKQLPNVTAVGDTTGGGSAGGTSAPGYQSPFRLPSGKWFDIGNLDIRRYDGVPWENLGVGVMGERTRWGRLRLCSPARWT
ncbi:MAG: S41 family peptidase [Gemmatimonadota bacterium]